jgi:hypothetical protein
MPAIGKRSIKRALGKIRRMRVERMHDFPKREILEMKVSTPMFNGESVGRIALSAFAGIGVQFVNELWRDHMAWGGRMEGQYDYFDMIVLFSMVDRFAVGNVIECSPHKGWSTSIIQKAMQRRAASHQSYDIVDYQERINMDMRRHTLPQQWEFILGDFKKTVDIESVKKADLLFIDSDHSADFAAWYLEEAKLPNLTRKGSLIAIHDIHPEGREPDGFGESPFVLRWLNDKQEIFDIFWTYEISRMPEIVREAPERAFIDHSGKPAANCSLWLYKK